MTAEISTAPESTDLERRVLAHERILQSLIAYMSRNEPRFLDHLAKTFVAPMNLERREQDFTDTDSHAEDFIRTVAQLDSTDVAAPPPVDEPKGQLPPPLRTAADASALLSQEDRVRTTLRNGIWTVVVDGVFAGDYTEREYAEAAAALARHVPR